MYRFSKKSAFMQNLDDLQLKKYGWRILLALRKNKLSSNVFSINNPDPNPGSEKMLKPDPNPDPT
jgi:hypothetical protein